MALDDDDRAEIAAMLDEREQRRPAPRTSGRAPAGSSGPADWDRASPRDIESMVRDMTEKRLAELDTEAELQQLRADNKALREERERARREGRKPRPIKGPGAGDGEEKPPSLVSRGATWLFGSVSQ